MFDRTADYPRAIADGTDEGLKEGFDWCVERMEHGDTNPVRGTEIGAVPQPATESVVEPVQRRPG